MEEPKKFLLMVTREEEAFLTQQGVKFSRVTPGDGQKILVEETQIKHCLLRLRKAILWEQPTGARGVYQTLLVPMEPDAGYEAGEELNWYKNILKIPEAAKELLFNYLCPPEQEREGEINWIKAARQDWRKWPDDNSFTRLAMKNITPKIKKKVQIHKQSGWTDPILGSDFYIHLHAAPSCGSHNTKSPPESIWGIEVSDRGIGTVDSGLGVSLVDEATGYAVAELIGMNNLYFHHDICSHNGDENELRIFEEGIARTMAIIEALAVKEKEKKPADWLDQEVFIAGANDFSSRIFFERLYGEAAKIVKQVLTPVIKRNVCLHGGEFGKKTQPFYDNMFHVFLGASPGLAIKNAPLSPPTPWGINIKLDNPKNSLVILNKGRAIYDNQGQVVAWLINGNNLYLPFYLTFETKENKEFFIRLLEEVNWLLKSTAAERQQREAGLMAIQKITYARVCQNYKEAILAKIKKETAGQELTETGSQIKNLQTQLVAANRRQDILRGVVEDKKEGKELYQERFAAEFEKIGQLDKIRWASFTKTHLIVETDILYYQHPTNKEIRLIGAFQIVIPFKGSCNDLRFFNLTQLINAHDSRMNAPHVYADGHACLGREMHEIIPELMARFDFTSIVIMCIIFLESANLDDIGRHVDQWPLVKTGQEEADKGKRKTS
ncbi:MAG: hypothetical protein PHT40_02975 [Patescibacteria group bacterium]|nr:hypothetical protein [Patescibacteria group bacterium]